VVECLSSKGETLVQTLIQPKKKKKKKKSHYLGEEGKNSIFRIRKKKKKSRKISVKELGSSVLEPLSGRQEAWGGFNSSPKFHSPTSGGRG
jgi:hypothetical protein